MIEAHDTHALLKWYLDCGVDETIADQPVDWYAASAALAARRMPASASDTAASDRAERPSRPAAAARGATVKPPTATRPAATRPAITQPRATLPVNAEAAAAGARERARAAATLEELRAALDGFEDCALKRTATNLVFADGNPDADIMLVGEAPGAEEDRQGLPFVGTSGQLLDRMLAAIGLDRTSAYITNVLPWRPPGNRSPSDGEVAMMEPFLERHIELVAPKVLVAVGGISAKTLLKRQQGITRLRGRWQEYKTDGMAAPIPVMAIFHPAFLLRQPIQKRATWYDLLAIRKRLEQQTG